MSLETTYNEVAALRGSEEMNEVVAVLPGRYNNRPVGGVLLGSSSLYSFWLDSSMQYVCQMVQNNTWHSIG